MQDAFHGYSIATWRSAPTKQRSRHPNWDPTKTTTNHSFTTAAGTAGSQHPCSSAATALLLPQHHPQARLKCPPLPACCTVGHSFHLPLRHRTLLPYGLQPPVNKTNSSNNKFLATGKRLALCCAITNSSHAVCGLLQAQVQQQNQDSSR